jgi:hypothetical protein
VRPDHIDLSMAHQLWAQSQFSFDGTKYVCFHVISKRFRSFDLLNEAFKNRNLLYLGSMFSSSLAHEHVRLRFSWTEEKSRQEWIWYRMRTQASDH